MKTIRNLLLTIVLLAPLFVNQPADAGPLAGWQNKVDSWVLETSTQGQTEFLVYMKDEADLSKAASLKTKLEKGVYVYQELSRLAKRTQKPLLAELEQRGVPHRSYWVVNAIWVRGDAELVQDLALRPDVKHLYANPPIKAALPEPAADPKFSAASAPADVSAIEWNIAKIQAPRVWSTGYTGQNVVIGGQDTGYDWDHPALINKYRGWDGTSADHNYNWHDAIHTGGIVSCPADSLVACDDHSHGTHTMGTMVGDDGGTNQIGVAPGAQWIGCRNMNLGVGTPTTYIECYEWFIAPYDLGGKNPDPSKAPDVINNSWACTSGEGCNPESLREVVQNVRAAGILTVHSAGNSGSSCSTVDTPGAIYDESFTVGNTSSTDTIATSSSRGPVLVDGSGRMKPDVSAPGSSIRSSVPGTSYSIMSGTSMAAPHVAGLAALLISARPELAGQVDYLELLISRSAVPRTTTQICGGIPGSEVPNNTYGWGRVDAWLAFQKHLLLIDKTAPISLVEPGRPFDYRIDLTHLAVLTPTTNLVITDTLPLNTSFVTATLPHTLAGSLVEWNFASLAPLGSESVTLTVQAPSEHIVLTNSLYGARSAEAPAVLGLPVEVFVGYFYRFAFIPYSLAVP